MNDDELLFAACLANPDEDTSRLALADWYDEHDEPELAAELRAGRKGLKFLAELVVWNSFPSAVLSSFENGAVNEAFSARVTARLMTRYRARFPVPPGARTEYQEDAPPPRAYKDPLNPSAFLGQWQHERRKQIAAIRELAARSADRRHGPHTFHSQPDAKGFEEQSCLLQELVLRGHDLTARAGAIEHHTRMRERGHPLVWLPLTTLAPEVDIAGWLPQFGPGGYAAPMRAVVPSAPVAVSTALPAVVAIDYPENESALFTAVRQWANESGGTLEGQIFRLDRPLAGVQPSWFTDLSDGSLRGATVTAATLGDAFAQLFSAAQNGGAYGQPRWGAYGRLNAWQSLGALCDCPAGADAHEIAASAARCEWFSFDGDWFDHIAGDLGLLCVRPDRLSVALLAATDAD